MSDNKITCKAGSVVATFAAPGDQERARWAALTATEAFAFRMGIPATATLCDEADIYHGGVSDIKIATDAGAVDVQQVLGWIEEATLIPPTASGTVALAKDAHATITALVAEIARLTAELAAARAEVDCGQDGPCAKAPGCARHWQERNRELVAELAAARAVPADVEAALCDSSCWICDREDPIRGANLDRVKAAIARAISDATAARGTVGGLLATAPVGAIVECFDGDTWLQFCILVDRSDRAVSGRWHDRRGRWCRWSVGGRYHVGYSFALPARLVPAAEADADPSQRGPLPKGG